MIFFSHANKTSYPYERLCTWPRFEKEVKSNSEMDYKVWLSAVRFKKITLRDHKKLGFATRMDENRKHAHAPSSTDDTTHFGE